MGTFEDIGISYSAVTSLLGLFIAGSVIIGLLIIIFKAMKSAAVCDMSYKLKITNAWYSFIPILGAFSYGRLAGIYRGKSNKENTSLSVALTVFEVLALLLSLTVGIMFLYGFIDLVFAADEALASGKTIDAQDYDLISKLLLPSLGLFAVLLIKKLFYTVCTYRIFCIFAPSKAVIFTVVSFFVSIALPLMLYSVKENEPNVSGDYGLNDNTGFRFS